MLSSIHPLGERAKNQRWSVTVTAHVLGAVIGGGLIGAALGSAGWVLAQAGIGLTSRVGLLMVVSFTALAVDALEWPRWLWRPHRQVDENWLTAYRGWVYGAGYGVQLGLGVSTIVTAATVYALGAFAIASGSAISGTVVGMVFGAGRGLSLIAARTVTTPERLIAFHRRMQDRRKWGRTAAVAGDAVLGVVALVVLVSAIAGGVA